MSNIGRGAAGPATKELQRRLKEKGYPDLFADGIYGSGTEEAVRDFQRRNGLAVDGIAGPDVFEALGLGRDFAAAAPRRVENEDEVKKRRTQIFISYSHRDTLAGQASRTPRAIGKRF